MRPKGARTMALSKEGSREQGKPLGKRDLGAWSTKIWKREQGAAKKGNGSRSQRNCQGAKGKISTT